MRRSHLNNGTESELSKHEEKLGGHEEIQLDNIEIKVDARK